MYQQICFSLHGVTPAPGLFVLGRSWQWTRGSALLQGVGKAAGFVITVLRYYLEDHSRQTYSLTEALTTDI